MSAVVAIRGLAFAIVLAASLPLAAAEPCVPDAALDWMVSVPLRPADCASVEQTPPDFSWPDLSSDARYQVTLTYPDGRSKTLTAPQNWINWDEVLPPGSYTWQVQATNASGIHISKSRRFTVAEGAVPLVVPDWSVLYNRALAKPRPRALPDPATFQTMISQRQIEFGLLAAQVDSQLAGPVQAEPTSTSTAKSQTLDECRRTLKAALAWMVTSNEAYLNDAMRRALNLASWNPRGSTSYAGADEAAREIAWTLALVYDWLNSRLDASQKNQLLDSILARAYDMYNDLIGGGRARIAVQPYDSHGNQTLTFLALITVLLAGDVRDAEDGLRDTLPLALHWTSPWGGEDGGYANGTGYSFWDTGEKLVPWYVLRWAVDVDIAQKAWVRNWGRFTTYFVPPGTRVGAFGDGAEIFHKDEWASYAKSYALFAPSPLVRWYASRLALEDPRRLEWLLAPPADSSAAPYPEATPEAAFFPSVGWAALHSSLEDPARVSVYFKSSFYGSYSHSHADQNSFVINSGGERLAIDSGYYDGTGTPHYLQWYKQTRAHNAITYDGGKGQVVFEETGQHFPGAVTRFEHHPGYDIVTGDATQTYGGALQDARRSMVYLRPNLALVYDRLASVTPRQWEWNIHALNQMNVVSDRQISITRNGQSLCVEMLAGPAMSFAQTDLFTVDASSGGFRQWHGRFHSVEPVVAAEFIALLNVGCTALTASASQSVGVWTVQVGDTTITIAPDGNMTVSETTAPTVAITSPAPGSTVSGTLTVAADASDKVGVVGVQFQYNGVNFDAEDTSAPYSVSADTTTVPNGSYTLTAVARDAAGNRTTSAPVTITVSNP